MSTPQLSEIEIQRMRAILAQHDSEHKPIVTLDLNNPPRVAYRFQKFPMMVYDHANSYPAHDEEQQRKDGRGFEMVHIPARVLTSTVHSEDQLRAALADGWQEEAPNFSEEPENNLSAGLQAEANRVQQQIEETRRKAGRPTNEERARRAALAGSAA